MKEPSNPRFARTTVTVTDKEGIHARPALTISHTAAEFASTISIIKGENRADGKSLFEVLALESILGTQLQIEARGEDAPRAVLALSELEFFTTA